MKLDIHTIATAPSGSKPLLEGVQKSLGFIPNLFGMFANSPAVLEGYLGLSSAFGKTSFSATEQQVISIAASVENECHYCVAAHTTVGKMQKVAPQVLEALRANQPLNDSKLEALRLFTKSVVNQRGWVREEEQEAFFAAGYTPTQAFEVVLGVAMKTLSNYANHLAVTPLEPAFAANAWKPSRLTEAATCTTETCGCAH
jgi:AhpD family alkylhydroperoxidase